MSQLVSQATQILGSPTANVLFTLPAPVDRSETSQASVETRTTARLNVMVAPAQSTRTSVFASATMLSQQLKSVIVTAKRMLCKLLLLQKAKFVFMILSPTLRLFQNFPILLALPNALKKTLPSVSWLALVCLTRALSRATMICRDHLPAHRPNLKKLIDRIS